MAEEDERPTETEDVETEEVITDPPAKEVAETETPAEEEAAEIEEAQRTLDDVEADLEVEKKRTGYLQRQLDKKLKATEPEEQPVVTEREKPARDDFADDEDWVEAVADWKADQKLDERERQRTVETRKQNFRKKLDPGFAKYKDFAEVALEKDMPQAMQDALYETENPADIAYFLGKNPSEARRISYLNPIAVAREIGRLEVELAKPPKKKPIISKAAETFETLDDTIAETVVIDEAKLTRKQRFRKWEGERLARAGAR